MRSAFIPYARRTGRFGVVSLIYLLTIFSVSAAIGCKKPSVERLSRENRYVLKMANWEDYLAPDTLSEFTRRTGIQVELVIYPDESVLLSRIQSDAAAFDVIVPSVQTFHNLMEQKLLWPLDPNQLLNRRNIDPQYLKMPHDPEGRYGVPYLMGTTGLAYDDRFFPKVVNSWKQLLEARPLRRAALLNNPGEVLAVGLRLVGESMNSDDAGKIEAAGRLLKKYQGNLRGFLDPIKIRQMLETQALIISQAYSGDVYFASQTNPHLKYIIPNEGGSMWVDMLAIPIEARHKDAALAFLNYMLEPGVNARCATYLGYATPNREARKLLPPELLDNPMFNPSADELERCEMFARFERSRSVRNRVWETLKNKQP